MEPTANIQDNSMSTDQLNNPQIEETPISSVDTPPTEHTSGIVFGGFGVGLLSDNSENFIMDLPEDATREEKSNIYLHNLEQKATFNSNSKKEIDFFMLDFDNNKDVKSYIDNGITINSAELKSRDFYKKNDNVRNLFKDKYGKFDEQAFNHAYNNALVKYNDLEDGDHTIPIVTNVGASPVLLSQKPHSVVNVRTASLGFAPNYQERSRSLVDIGLEGERVLSDREIAQRSLVFDTKSGEFTNTSAEDWGVLNLFRKDALVLAKWDSDGTHFDPLMQADIEHKKGELKYNSDYKPYYETLNGRDVYDKDVLSAWDILTKEGSTWNKYFFLEGDDLKKGIVSSLASSAVKAVPYLIPYVNTAFVMKDFASIVPTVASIAEGMFTNDDHNSAFLNRASAFFRSMETSTSDYARENVLSTEGVIESFGDVFGQLAGQSLIAKHIGSIGGSIARKRADKIFSEGLNRTIKEGTEEVYDVALKKTVKRKFTTINGKRFEGVGLDDARNILLRNAELSKYAKDWSDAGRYTSMAYMAVLSGADSYWEARNAGWDERNAGLIGLATIGGYGALMATPYAQWIFPHKEIPEVIQRKHISMLIKDSALKNLANEATTETEKKVVRTQIGKFLNSKALGFLKNKKIIEKGALLSSPEVYQNALTQMNNLRKFGVKSILNGSMNEMIEEGSEQLVSDAITTLFNKAYDKGFIENSNDVENHAAWSQSNGLQIYLMNIIGGALGGAIGGVSGLRVMNQSGLFDQENFDDKAYKTYLVSQLRQGNKKELVDYVKKLKDEGAFGSKTLSMEVDSLASSESGKTVFKPISQSSLSTSQNDFIADRVLNQIEVYDKIIGDNNLSLSDHEFIDKAIKSNFMAGALISDKKNLYNDALDDFYAISQGIVDIENKIRETEASRTDPEKRADRDNGVESSVEQTLAQYRTSLDNLKNEYKQIINGELAPEYISRAIFASSVATAPEYLPVSFDSYLRNVKRIEPSDIIDEEQRETLLKDYDAYKSSDNFRDKVRIAYDDHKRISKILKDQIDSYESAGHSFSAYSLFGEHLSKELNALNFNPDKVFDLIGEKFHDAEIVKLLKSRYIIDEDLIPALTILAKSNDKEAIPVVASYINAIATAANTAGVMPIKYKNAIKEFIGQTSGINIPVEILSNVVYSSIRENPEYSSLDDHQIESIVNAIAIPASVKNLSALFDEADESSMYGAFINPYLQVDSIDDSKINIDSIIENANIALDSDNANRSEAIEALDSAAKVMLLMESNYTTSEGGTTSSVEKPFVMSFNEFNSGFSRVSPVDDIEVDIYSASDSDNVISILRNRVAADPNYVKQLKSAAKLFNEIRSKGESVPISEKTLPTYLYDLASKIAGEYANDRALFQLKSSIEAAQAIEEKYKKNSAEESPVIHLLNSVQSLDGRPLGVVFDDVMDRLRKSTPASPFAMSDSEISSLRIIISSLSTIERAIAGASTDNDTALGLRGINATINKIMSSINSEGKNIAPLPTIDKNTAHALSNGVNSIIGSIQYALSQDLANKELLFRDTKKTDVASYMSSHKALAQMHSSMLGEDFDDVTVSAILDKDPEELTNDEISSLIKSYWTLVFSLKGKANKVFGDLSKQENLAKFLDSAIERAIKESEEELMYSAVSKISPYRDSLTSYEKLMMVAQSLALKDSSIAAYSEIIKQNIDTDGLVPFGSQLLTAIQITSFLDDDASVYKQMYKKLSERTGLKQYDLSSMFMVDSAAGTGKTQIAYKMAVEVYQKTHETKNILVGSPSSAIAEKLKAVFGEDNSVEKIDINAIVSQFKSLAIDSYELFTDGGKILSMTDYVSDFLSDDSKKLKDRMYADFITSQSIRTEIEKALTNVLKNNTSIHDVSKENTFVRAYLEYLLFNNAYSIKDSRLKDLKVNIGNGGEILFMDESTLVSTGDLNVLNHIMSNNAGKVVLMGDTAQLERIVYMQSMNIPEDERADLPYNMAYNSLSDVFDGKLLLLRSSRMIGNYRSASINLRNSLDSYQSSINDIISKISQNNTNEISAASINKGTNVSYNKEAIDGVFIAGSESAFANEVDKLIEVVKNLSQNREEISILFTYDVDDNSEISKKVEEKLMNFSTEKNVKVQFKNISEAQGNEFDYVIAVQEARPSNEDNDNHKELFYFLREQYVAASRARRAALILPNIIQPIQNASKTKSKYTIGSQIMAMSKDSGGLFVDALEGFKVKTIGSAKKVKDVTASPAVEAVETDAKEKAPVSDEGGHVADPSDPKNIIRDIDTPVNDADVVTNVTQTDTPIEKSNFSSATLDDLSEEDFKNKISDSNRSMLFSNILMTGMGKDASIILSELSRDITKRQLTKETIKSLSRIFEKHLTLGALTFKDDEILNIINNELKNIFNEQRQFGLSSFLIKRLEDRGSGLSYDDISDLLSDLNDFYKTVYGIHKVISGKNSNSETIPSGIKSKLTEFGLFDEGVEINFLFVNGSKKLNIDGGFLSPNSIDAYEALERKLNNENYVNSLFIEIRRGDGDKGNITIPLGKTSSIKANEDSKEDILVKSEQSILETRSGNANRERRLPLNPENVKKLFFSALISEKDGVIKSFVSEDDSIRSMNSGVNPTVMATSSTFIQGKVFTNLIQNAHPMYNVSKETYVLEINNDSRLNEAFKKTLPMSIQAKVDSGKPARLMFKVVRSEDSNSVSDGDAIKKIMNGDKSAGIFVWLSNKKTDDRKNMLGVNGAMTKFVDGLFTSKKRNPTSSSDIQQKYHNVSIVNSSVFDLSHIFFKGVLSDLEQINNNERVGDAFVIEVLNTLFDLLMDQKVSIPLDTIAGKSLTDKNFESFINKITNKETKAKAAIALLTLKNALNGSNSLLDKESDIYSHTQELLNALSLGNRNAMHNTVDSIVKKRVIKTKGLMKAIVATLYSVDNVVDAFNASKALAGKCKKTSERILYPVLMTSRSMDEGVVEIKGSSDDYSITGVLSGPRLFYNISAFDENAEFELIGKRGRITPIVREAVKNKLELAVSEVFNDEKNYSIVYEVLNSSDYVLKDFSNVQRVYNESDVLKRQDLPSEIKDASIVARVDIINGRNEIESVYYAITDELNYKTFTQNEYEEMLTSRPEDVEADEAKTVDNRIDHLYVKSTNETTFLKRTGSNENGSVYTIRTAMKNDPEDTTDVQVVIPESVNPSLAEALLSLISTFPIKSSVTGSFLLMPSLIQTIDKSGGKSLPEGSTFLAVMPRTESGDIDVPMLNNILTLLKENTTITNC